MASGKILLAQVIKIAASDRTKSSQKQMSGQVAGFACGFLTAGIVFWNQMEVLDRRREKTLLLTSAVRNMYSISPMSPQQPLEFEPQSVLLKGVYRAESIMRENIVPEWKQTWNNALTTIAYTVTGQTHA